MKRRRIAPVGTNASPIPRTDWRQAVLATLSLALTLAGCGTDGTKFPGGPPSAEATYGECVFCHRELATHMAETGGHHDLGLRCQACHENLLPGEVGPGHRSKPRCADCHRDQETHHDPALGTATECTQCHTPHGSRNLRLVNESISTPTGEVRPVEFINRDGLADGSYASASDPGSGACEICHTTTRFYRSDGSGQQHFVSNCIVCHGHQQGFALSISLDRCELCHGEIVDRMGATGGHGVVDSNCQACHENLLPGTIGPGHRSVPRCADCHLEQQTHHDPAVGTATECTQCHSPHGSPNLRLVNESISTPAGGARPVEFINRDGLADGSYASATDPGSGACEICHTTTKFYRGDGSGQQHFVSNCIVCHGHEQGFALSISLDNCTVCHGEIVDRMDATGGHGVVDSNCQACHENLLPGEVGPGHRSKPRCADCHRDEETHHDPALGTATECTQCHTPHGSRNLRLVKERISTPAGGARPVEFINRNGLANGSYASVNDPGSGVCEICHTTTRFYRSDGSGQQHFVSNCIVCHGHEQGFALSISLDDCTVCHGGIVDRMGATGGHGTVDSNCQACHQNLLPGEVGQGHRSVPRCAECHLDKQTHHDPAAGTATECTQCHTPHGSPNLRLVRESISTPAGGVRPVEFTSTNGLADGSYASVSHPGSGVCEICHTATQFYRGDGSGQQHETDPCVDCHSHAAAFTP